MIISAEISYISKEQAVQYHAEVMKFHNETRCGLNSLEMLESALARPQNAAVYENADLLRQAATLYFGLVKNRIWRGGNKRTATVLLKHFLELNGRQPAWTLEEVMKLGRNVDNDVWKVDEIESWLRERVKACLVFH